MARQLREEGATLDLTRVLVQGLRWPSGLEASMAALDVLLKFFLHDHGEDTAAVDDASQDITLFPALLSVCRARSVQPGEALRLRTSRQAGRQLKAAVQAKKQALLRVRQDVSSRPCLPLSGSACVRTLWQACETAHLHQAVASVECS